MKTVQLSELGAVAEDVRNGETVEIRHGETVVAKVVPARVLSDEEWIATLEKDGKITRGTGTLPDSFFTEEPPKFEGSVLEQLLADRRKERLVKFWDSSALVPLIADEPKTQAVTAILAAPSLFVAFITPVEVESAIRRPA